MLLDLTRSALASQPCKFVLVKQSDDGVLARPKYEVNRAVSSSPRIATHNQQAQRHSTRSS